MLPRQPCFYPARDYLRERWRNGEGWTRQILAVPEAQDWTLRLSIAELSTPARYSHFPGVEREQMLLSGQGLRLDFDGGGQVSLLPPYQRHRFSGGHGLQAVPDGPVTALNLMWKPDRVQVQSWHRPLVGDLFCFVTEGTAWIVHLLAGQMRVQGGGASYDLEQGDTAWLAGVPGTRFAIDGGGEALLVKVQQPGAEGAQGLQLQ
jgi:environmental stress-induced protein Ves